MTKERELLTLALEALEDFKKLFVKIQELGIYYGASSKDARIGEVLIHDRAIADIKAALAQPVQEPVAWFRYEDGICIYYGTKAWDDLQPLYTTPPLPVQKRPNQVKGMEWLSGLTRTFSIKNGVNLSATWDQHSQNCDVVISVATPPLPVQPEQEPMTFDAFLNSRDFYELMQTYRHFQIDAFKQFEAVKDALRAAHNIGAKP